MKSKKRRCIIRTNNKTLEFDADIEILQDNREIIKKQTIEGPICTYGPSDPAEIELSNVSLTEVLSSIPQSGTLQLFIIDRVCSWSDNVGTFTKNMHTETITVKRNDTFNI